MDFAWEEVITVDDHDISEQKFWDGVKVWIQRPHLVNKRLSGIYTVKSVEIPASYCYRECGILLRSCGTKESVLSDYGNISDPFAHQIFHKAVLIRQLLPKQHKFDVAEELLIIDKHKNSIEFVPLPNSNEVSLSPQFPYKIICCQSKVSLLISELGCDASRTKNQDSIEWLRNKVLPKIIQWSKITGANTVPSLSQVSLPVYFQNYNYMKQKYGRKLVECWPEKTDPCKFVYEDIATAAYLMSFWEEERTHLNLTRKQSFVELGCGNGLLVYLLASEGYEGIGVDVRKRKIWDFYGENTRLIEQTIVPSNAGLFPSYDWIIGNHSDELTPWIPVIAARSSYNMRIFLLPCCAYTFDGKYERNCSQVSKYQSYLDFIEELCTAMGFNTCRDKLRIPSTKRICLIGMSRNYDPKSEEIIDGLRTEFIKKHSKTKQNQPISIICNVDANHSDFIMWSQSFEPREKQETVRNCANLMPSFIKETLIHIMLMLLNISENCIELCIDGEKVHWNSGGSMPVKEIAAALKQETLMQLKNQSGGLQTLLKNHRNIFKVSEGFVSLRIPPLEPKNSTQAKKFQVEHKNYGDKPCLFYFYHPDSCPLSDECTFSHED